MGCLKPIFHLKPGSCWVPNVHSQRKPNSHIVNVNHIPLALTTFAELTRESPTYTHIPLAHVGARIGCKRVGIGCTRVGVGCTRVFRYQHVCIGNAKVLRGEY